MITENMNDYIKQLESVCRGNDNIAPRLFEEYGVQYENGRNHAGRKITLTPVSEKA